MKRWFVLGSLLLSGLIAGCASDTDLHVLQADTSILQRQNSERHQTVEARVQQLSERVAQFEQSQLAARRDLARINATLDELRVQLQRLRGDVQETQIQAQRGTTGGEGAAASRLTNFETRLGDLEKQLRVLPR
jgi:outer membrane murein-binding lipoprotein Lpp